MLFTRAFNAALLRLPNRTEMDDLSKLPPETLQNVLGSSDEAQAVHSMLRMHIPDTAFMLSAPAPAIPSLVLNNTSDADLVVPTIMGVLTEKKQWVSIGGATLRRCLGYRDAGVPLILTHASNIKTVVDECAKRGMLVSLSNWWLDVLHNSGDVSVRVVGVTRKNGECEVAELVRRVEPTSQPPIRQFMSCTHDLNTRVYKLRRSFDVLGPSNPWQLTATVSGTD